MANLDLSSRAQLELIIRDISFAQVRQLNALQKLRKLTPDDLWPVPERFQLRNAYAEFKINTNESMFLVRAIIRMIWKPMIPIHIAGMLFKLLPICKTILNGYIYQCLDSPDSTVYSKAYMAAAVIASAGFYAFEMVLELLVGHSGDWDPTRDYVGGDSISSVYFNIKTVKMFGWENMYLDPKLKGKREYMTRLLWYAPLVRALLGIVDIARTLVNSISIYVTVALYLNGMSASDKTMTNSQLLEMAEHIETLRGNILGAFNKIKNLSDLVSDNSSVESAFRCETFNTISHVELGEFEAVPSIRLDNCRFKWRYNASILKNISLNVTAGELVGVVGKTGSGKTSLMLALCKEMEMTKGDGTVVGRVGYLEQSPWIMNATMRTNILFGREFDEEYYWKVIHACALAQDLESWPDSDMTVIGERGINISGGQRARLALARTVYSRADVYILDDPLSAVDAHVKRHILDNVILSSGLLGDKLRVVTTHAESMLPFCNQIVTVSGKTVSVIRQEPKEHIYIEPAAVTPNDVCESTIDETDPNPLPAAFATDANSLSTASNNSPAAAPSTDKKQLLPQKPTLWENTKYVFKFCGWHVVGVVVVSASFRPISKFILDGYRVDALRENAQSDTVSHDAVLWYLKIGLIKAATSYMLVKLEQYVSNFVSKDKLKNSLKDTFVHSLLHAPLSLIEKTSRHRIDSAYDDGTSAMSQGIPNFLSRESANAIESVLFIWRSALATPQLMLIVPFIVWARVKVSKFTQTTSNSLRSIRNDFSTSHSQTSSIISEGGLMIRLFGVEPYFMSRYISDKDEAMKLHSPQASLGLLSGMIGTGVYKIGNLLSILSVLVQSHLTSHKVNSGQLKMLVSDLNSLVDNIGRLVKVPGRVKGFSEDVSTFRQFSDLEPEAPYIVEDCRVPSEWPHSGNVEFKNLSVRYGADLDYALKNLNITIRPGEKIGIVGRTGAGKSTLAKLIFRLLNENVKGSIEIDGHDTAKFGVGDFRPKLGIIPQESTMFSGTVKRNLDPLNEFTIEDMWAAMIKCGVTDLIGTPRKRKPAKLTAETSSVSSNAEEEEEEDDDEEDEYERAAKLRWESAGLLVRAMLLVFSRKQSSYIDETRCRIGINKQLGRGDGRFSSGQQQLFSLCRLLMRKRKVLILDEATADVDLETDHKMQELIRREFSECTVLTIAHRLDTIMNSDRIIVMEKGEIAEIGPPQELIANGGMFAKLVQANEF
ncbi:Canalicular multispecific organic anion transporter 2 [Coemansia sp. S3946]|nr:Canalicular multispecific organic anion transporter 2 [Coemansia sp. S3946]